MNGKPYYTRCAALPETSPFPGDVHVVAAYHPSDGRSIPVLTGCNGYYEAPSLDVEAFNEAIRGDRWSQDYFNHIVEAAVAGSMFGWTSNMADPTYWETLND